MTARGRWGGMLVAQLVRFHRTQFGVVFVVTTDRWAAEQDRPQLYFTIERVRGTSTSAWFFDLARATGVRMPLGRA